jgi:hypothetical protein
MEQQITPPNVGEHWAGQGGFYAGIVRNPNNGQCWHLIMHAEEIMDIAWGPRGKEIADCDSYHDGTKNSAAMLASGFEHPVIDAIGLIVADGHNDFYLPAQRELNLLCVNLPDKCSDLWHWSSTQGDADDAWVQVFSNGYQGFDCKDYERAARAVRRILIIE